MKGKLGDKQRLQHILDAIFEIEQYTADVEIEVFLENSMMRFAAIKQIEIIGEAANHLSESTKNKFQGIIWRQIIGMRNILIHEYFGIDSQLIWQIIVIDIPQLKTAIQSVMASGNIG